MSTSTQKAAETTKISWPVLAFMAFSTVWGFGNITNGFVYFNGPQVIFSWILMFALYFIPYALMVGELGSAFKNEGGGVSSSDRTAIAAARSSRSPVSGPPRLSG